MGSSVTAGHDSPFNLSFPILTGAYLSPVFSELGIKVDSRNAAMGNNPCMPYDVCTKTFAGIDADIVHWEQSYNCFGSNGEHRVNFEQFIRQSLSIPSHPVVIFSESSTPNWKPDECPKSPGAITITAEEKEMLSLLAKGDALKIVAEKNLKAPWVDSWGAILDIVRHYKLAGVQMWTHFHYQEYKCRGPYVKDWACCSASWYGLLICLVSIVCIVDFIGIMLRADSWLGADA